MNEKTPAPELTPGGPQGSPGSSSTSLTAVAARALAYALSDFPVEVAAEMEWLDTGQLQRLARAANMIKMFAEDTMASRAPGGYARTRDEARHPRRCPDNGYCHHGCTLKGCWRVRAGDPLSGVFEGNQWPAEVIAEQGGESGGRL